MTLVEIMIVVAIMALITGAVAFAVVPMFSTAKDDKAKTDIGTITQAAQLAYSRSGGCPTVDGLVEDEILAGSLGNDDGEGGSANLDPWGNEYVIECDRSNVRVFSPGADGTPGTEDDIE